MVPVERKKLESCPHRSSHFTPLKEKHMAKCILQPPVVVEMKPKRICSFAKEVVPIMDVESVHLVPVCFRLYAAREMIKKATESVVWEKTQVTSLGNFALCYFPMFMLATHHLV